jgi:hypothetical protein
LLENGSSEGHNLALTGLCVLSPDFSCLKNKPDFLCPSKQGILVNGRLHKFNKDSLPSGERTAQSLGANALSGEILCRFGGASFKQSDQANILIQSHDLGVSPHAAG